jgi:hypothetical protein
MLEPNALKSSLWIEGEDKERIGAYHDDVWLNKSNQKSDELPHLHPASLSLRAYILPMSPIPMMPTTKESIIPSNFSDGMLAELSHSLSTSAYTPPHKFSVKEVRLSFVALENEVDGWVFQEKEKLKDWRFLGSRAELSTQY